MNVRGAVMPMVCLLVIGGSAFAQHRVDPGSSYARIYAIVPMIGSGTWTNPKRPAFAPPPSVTASGVRTGVIGFNQVTSDDGNFALIEIVAANQQELAKITVQMNTQLSAASGFQLFNRATTLPATVQTAFQALKKNFDITAFSVVVP